MKSTIYLIAFLFVLTSCKPNQKEEKQLTIVEKIANAHGFETWDKVKTFEFTFGGKIDVPNSGRSWIWNPKTNAIKLVRDSVVTEYNRNDMDTTAIKADRAFINDKYWALVPFQLIWDEGLTISAPVSAVSPVKQEELFKITITYSNEGGYTPGDAYDIYYDNEFIIKEWSYRKENAPEPSLSNTFENYQEFSGIKIALEHKKVEGDWNLLLRNVKVELEE